MPTTRINIADSDRWRQGDHPIHAYVDAASTIIAPSWPIRTFIARNPLMGLDELPFSDAVRRGRAVLGGRGYLTEEKFRAFYRAGRITDEDIDRALARVNPPLSPNLRDQSLLPGVDLVQVIRLHLIDGLDRPVPFSPSAPTYDTRRDFSLWTLILDKLSQSTPHSEESAIHPLAHGAGTHVDQVCRRTLETDLDERFTTLSQWCDQLTGQRLVEQINDQMIKWCAAFLDEGQAAWAMPGRERGFYRAWRELAARDWAGRLLGIRRFAQQVRELPEPPEDALVASLSSLGIPQARWSEYLAHHLGQLPGWAGYIKWRADNPGYAWQAKYPINLVEYLAVRLFYEAALVQEVCDRTWHIRGNLDDMRRYFRRHPHEYYVRRETGSGRAGRGRPNGVRVKPVDKRTAENPWLSEAVQLYHDRALSEKLRQAGIVFHLIRSLDVSDETVQALDAPKMAHWVEWVDSLTPEIRAQIWQEAFEEHYRRDLLGRLARRADQQAAPDSAAARTQVAFCIDVRSEGFRRHLEELGDYETYGFAGFFGVPAIFRPFLSDEEAHLYPAIAKPAAVVVEAAEHGQPRAVEQVIRMSRWQKWLRHLLHDLKQNMVAPFALVESIGWLWGSVLAGKTVAPGALGNTLNRWRERIMPSVPTTLFLETVHRPADGVFCGPAEAGADEVAPRDGTEGAGGLTPEEQAEFVESALRTMGPPRRFGRIMLFLGHGSHSENNPHASALHCGAAGGHRGGPSARILAAMANQPAVRQLLRQRGLDIPDETWFMAGEHNTTTDQVALFDQWRAPSSHRAEVIRLMDDLAEAGARNVQARYRSLPGAPRHLDRADIRRLAYERSVNWAETRPEWGLAANAAMIVGRRAVTRGLDLDGRAFLHSYDYAQDPDGTVLEAIMAGPLVVAHWINMEYYFSTVDNEVYGSGSKVTQNVVGQIGVMQGSRGDLRPGLPRQSVMADEDDARHEPMRLLAVIEAPAVRVSAAIHRNPALKRLLANEWIRLVALDPETGRFFHYRPDGRWEHAESDAAPCRP